MGDTRGSPKLAWIENRYKLLTSLDGGQPLLYDLQQDPSEAKDLAAARCLKESRRWKPRCRNGASPAEPVELVSETD